MKRSAWLFLGLILVDVASHWAVLRYAPNLASSEPRFVSVIPVWIGMLVGSMLLAFLAVWAIRSSRRMAAWWWLAAGFCGNVVTYAWLGSFHDFIDWGIGKANLADLYVVIGIVLIVWHESRHHQKGEP